MINAQLASFTVETEVVRRRAQKRKSSTDSYLTVAPTSSIADPREVEIDQNLQQACREGSRVRLTCGSGALGIRWLRRVEVVE
jgi:hypothetical protein